MILLTHTRTQNRIILVAFLFVVSFSPLQSMWRDLQQVYRIIPREFKQAAFFGAAAGVVEHCVVHKQAERAHALKNLAAVDPRRKQVFERVMRDMNINPKTVVLKSEPLGTELYSLPGIVVYGSAHDLFASTLGFDDSEIESIAKTKLRHELYHLQNRDHSFRDGIPSGALSVGGYAAYDVMKGVPRGGLYGACMTAFLLGTLTIDSVVNRIKEQRADTFALQHTPDKTELKIMGEYFKRMSEKYPLYSRPFLHHLTRPSYEASARKFLKAAQKES